MRNFLLSIFSAAYLLAAASDIDYSGGIIFVNEDWYGHQNSTINYLLPDDPDGNYWHYRVIQSENPGVEIGCTSQYGALWNGRLYLIAKQDKDPGAAIAGGRITVADAKTMKVIHQAREIDPSGAQCDGRAFVGVSENKGYISSSNGIWILDLVSNEITGHVVESENPNTGSDSSVTNPGSSLYHGQTGKMILAGDYIFAAHQQYGLLVIDPGFDKVVKTIPLDFVADGAGIGSIVQSKDGMLWISVAKDISGSGTPLPFLVKMNPATLEYDTISLPEGINPPLNSWYAWTPDAFVSSSLNNVLYWKGGTNRWFEGSKIYKFDIDKNEFSLFIDLSKDGENWKLYGCSIGVDPLNDDIYMSLYHEFSQPTYITRRYAASSEKIRDYEMISNYWFPSMPIFMQTSGQNNVGTIDSEVNTILNIAVNSNRVYVSGATCAVELFDLFGRRLDSATPSFNGETVSLSLPDANGIYIIRSANKVIKRVF